MSTHNFHKCDTWIKNKQQIHTFDKVLKAEILI